MALITSQSWTQANQYVANYFATGHYQGQGNQPKPDIQTPERLIMYFQDLFAQMGGRGSTHVSTGTGGVLVALLARYPDQVKARQMASEILHGGSITLSSGQRMNLGVGTSGCSNAALNDFIGNRGVVAGRA